MNKTLKKLQDAKAARTKMLREITEKPEGDDGKMTAEQEAEFETLSKELDGINRDIKREERILALEAELAVTPDRTADAEAEAQKKLKPTLPAIPVRERPKYFKGPDAQKDAFLAGHFFLAIRGNEKSKEILSQFGEQLSQSEGVNTAGGYVVPTPLSNSIIDLRETYGVFRQNVRVMPMSSDTLMIPRRTSGTTAYFVGENSAITESQKAWDGVTLTAKKLASLVTYSSEINEDAIISLADDLAFEIGYGFALKEDQCGFIGDGTSTYGGIVGAAVAINDGTHAAGIATAASGNVSFETFDLDDFEAAMGKCPQYALPNAKWYISAYGYATSMARLQYAAGGNTVSNIAGSSGQTFLGYPVVISQVLNSTAGSDVSKIKCLFGDLRLAAKLGDRRMLTIATTNERYFEYDQIAIKGTERLDIVVHDLGDGTNAGPIVALKTAAS